MAYSQDDRLIAIDTQLGKDALLLAGFSGSEGMSRLFDFELAMLSENHAISFEQIIGKNVTVSVILASGDKRYFNGIISRFSQGRGGAEKGGDPRFSVYRATMVPWLWLLTRTADSRIFQQLTVPDIIEKIFRDLGFSDFAMRLQGNYDKRDYCVQYRETDFNFVSRLMEEEGIHYFFEHENGKHTLVLADAPQENKPCPGQRSARYQLSGDGWLEEDVITGIEMTQEIRPAKYALNDFNFEIPNTDLKVNVPSRKKLGTGEREIYDYPGAYAKRNEGDRYVRLRMEEEEAQITTITGSSTCRPFTSGYRFTLTSFYRNDMNNKEYVLTSLEHEVSQGWEEGSKLAYGNRFTCIPFDVPFRPPSITRKPVVRGTQTAIVVGPAGEEIYTDQHARVKVQFHWDREGKKNENSSCWIRVGQVWAGEGWGAIHIPRIGQEVIVDFLEGDPDRPIVTGRVYNASQTPPYKLPDNKTQSGIKSRSSKTGTADNYNEIRFEDKKGSEQILVHAERDMDTTIERNETRDVGGDRTVHVAGHFTETIDNGETRTVDAGSEETINGGSTQTIHGGETRTVTGGVAESITGGETRTVAGGQTETITGGETRTVNGAFTETINGALTQTISGPVTFSAPSGVTVNAPGGYTMVVPGGIRTVDSFFDRMGSAMSEFFGTHQQTIMNNQSFIGGLNLDQKNVSIELNTAKMETTYMSYTLKTLDTATTGISIHNKPLELNWGFHIIS
jgi:type VI secretion system secreted protein VgrG